MKKNIFKLFVSLLSLVFSYQSFAQDKTITETVTSLVNKMPITGVSISVKGEKQAIATDFTGVFSIRAVADKATLVFKFIGYKTLE